VITLYDGIDEILKIVNMESGKLIVIF